MANNSSCWSCDNCRTWTDFRNDDEHAPYCPNCGHIMSRGLINPTSNVPYSLEVTPVKFKQTFFCLGIVSVCFGVLCMLNGLLGSGSDRLQTFMSGIILVIVGGVMVIIDEQLRKRFIAEKKSTTISKITYSPRAIPSPVYTTMATQTSSQINNFNKSTVTTKQSNKYDLALPATLTAIYGDFIRKYQYTKVDIVGEKYLEDKSFITEDLLRKQVVFIPEPENQYDSLALRIDCEGHKLGYMSQKSRLREMIYDFNKRGDEVAARIDSINTDTFDITLIIGFYVHLETMNCKECKLIGNRSEEAQTYILFSSSNEEVDLSYDYEKERYTTNSIGHLSTSDTKFIQNLDDEKFISIISRVEEDDSGKRVVWIKIFY